MFERPWLDLCVGLSSLFFSFFIYSMGQCWGTDRFDVNVESDGFLWSILNASISFRGFGIRYYGNDVIIRNFNNFSI